MAKLQSTKSIDPQYSIKSYKFSLLQCLFSNTELFIGVIKIKFVIESM